MWNAGSIARFRRHEKGIIPNARSDSNVELPSEASDGLHKLLIHLLLYFQHLAKKLHLNLRLAEVTALKRLQSGKRGPINSCYIHFFLLWELLRRIEQVQQLLPAFRDASYKKVNRFTTVEIEPDKRIVTTVALSNLLSVAAERLPV